MARVNDKYASKQITSMFESTMAFRHLEKFSWIVVSVGGRGQVSDTLSPYELQNADGLKFKMRVTGGNILNLDHCAQGISISVDTSKNPAMANNEEMFHLGQIYQTHADYAAEIYVRKVMKENGKYLQATKGMLKPHINLTNDDVRRIQNGFYTNPNDFSKRPLSKFRTDLAKDAGLL